MSVLAQSPAPEIEGSELWRLAFFVGAAVLIGWQMWRGWHLGLPQALAGPLAIIAGYAAAWIAGPRLMPFLRPMVKSPDFLLTILAGSAAALVTYGLITIAAAALFKSTKDQKNPVIRFIYGASGSVVGLVVGVAMVWIALLAIRLLGTIAEGQFAPVARTLTKSNSVVTSDRTDGQQDFQPPPLATFVARLRNSIEMGVGAVVTKMVDPVPEEVYRVTRKVTLLLQSPEAAERLLNYPGVNTLVRHPKLIALTEDATIRKLINERDFVRLLQNEKIISAANDPELAGKLRGFPLEKALDYSLAPASDVTPALSPAARVPRA